MRQSSDEQGAVRWELRPASGDWRVLATKLGIHPVTARILDVRGFGTPSLATRFLNPGWDDILEPHDLPHFDCAVARVTRAIARRERIVVFGDYDVDGLTATAILVNAIRIVGGNVSWSIPHRLLDGYGLREKHVDAIVRQGAGLIITVDCGIRSFEAVQFANCRGIDVIIIDHHLPDCELPVALAVVNPNRRDSTYSNRCLCGAGLTYQFAAGLFHAMLMPKRRTRELLASFIKLAAVATVADVAPLVGENRAIVHLGLQGLADIRSPGLRLLLESAGIPSGQPPTAREVAFRLAPRINAAGRLEDAALILDLLATRDPITAASLVQKLERINQRRKAEQARVLEEIAAMAAVVDGQPVAVFSGRSWHRGILGIVAARLVEQLQRPVFALAIENGLAHGSGRSVPGVDLNALLKKVSHHLEAFGGHEQAAGVTLRADRIDAFLDEICVLCETAPAEEVIQIDANLRLEEAVRLWPEILRLEPFGHGNPPPVFATRVQAESAPVSVNPWVVKMRVWQKDRTFEVKQFGRKAASVCINPGDKIDLAYTVQPDRWNREGFSMVLETLRQVV
jgi:single-stranded-DNA-specific exonuclease